MNTNTHRPMRDELIGEVENGRMEPDEAEAEASELGIGPLASSAATEAFDPMHLDRWTPAMALAWVIWRSVQKVREYWREYREDCWHWVFQRHRLGLDGEIREGYFLEQLPPATVVRLPLDVRFDELVATDGDAGDEPINPHKSFEQARSEMWEILARGSLKASAIDRESQERTEIQASLWHDLEAIEQHGRDVFIVRKLFPHGPAFDDVLINAAMIRDLWLPVLAAGERKPVLVRPEAGYLPLSAAAHWLATEGGTIDVIDETLREGYRRLLKAIVDGSIEAIGTSDGVPGPIPGYVFASCRVGFPSDPPDDGVVLSETLALVCHPYFGDDLWRSGFDDSLRNWNGPRWRRISVKSTHLVADFPYTAVKQIVYTNPHRTGAPGRPGSKHLYLLEFKQRAARGEVCEKVGLEAEALQAWFTSAHPDINPLQLKSLKNAIRTAFNQHHADKVRDQT